MSSVVESGGVTWLETKGAPEVLLARCGAVLSGDGTDRPLEQSNRTAMADDTGRLRQ